MSSIDFEKLDLEISTLENPVQENIGLDKSTPVYHLLSGGVDSSLALALLVKQGFTNVKAVYLKIWLEDDLAFLGQCPWEEDLQYCRETCDQLGVPLEIINFQSVYWDKVVGYTLRALEKGLTPSPDLFCNKFVKFGSFAETVRSRSDGDSAPWISSGHYAQLLPCRDSTQSASDKRQIPAEEIFGLVQGVDPVKDQSYFLSMLTLDDMQRVLFPIGSLQKAQVRKLAEEMELPAARRADSQGICFLGKISYRDFVQSHLGTRVGEIVNEANGEVLGEHKGYWFHTIGQRKGLGLSGGPWLISRKDCESNVLYVRHDTQRKSLANKSVGFRNFNNLTKTSPLDLRISHVKLRHGPQKNPVMDMHWKAPEKKEAEVKDQDHNSYHGIVEMENGDSGIAPGQHVVFYEGMRCLGSAEITSI